MKKLFLSIFLFFLLCSFSVAAITLDTSDYSTYGTDGPLDIDLPLTIASNNNRLLIATAWCETGGDKPANCNDLAVSWNGSSLTRIACQQFNNDYTEAVCQFYILNPDTGSHNLNFSSADSRDIGYGGAVYYGVKQQAPEDSSTAYGLTSGYNTEHSDSLTSTDGAQVLWVVGTRQNQIWIGTSDTLLSVLYPPYVVDKWTGGWGVADGSITGAGSNNFYFQIYGNSDEWAFVGSSWEAAAESSTRRRSFVISQ